MSTTGGNTLNCDCYYYDTGTSSATTWTAWNTTSVGTVTSTDTASTLYVNGQVWGGWVAAVVPRMTIVPDTQEHERMAEALKQQREKFEEAERERKEALERSRQLLLSMLNEEQTKSFEDKGWFDVAGEKSKYRIKPATTYNVERMNDEGKTVEKLCCVPNDSVPLFDHMLAQMLHIQANEKQFVQIANKNRVN